MLPVLLISSALAAAPRAVPLNEASSPVTGEGNCTVPESESTSVEQSFSVSEQSWLEVDELVITAAGFHLNCDVFLRDLRVEIDGRTIFLEDLNIKRGLSQPNISEVRTLRTEPIASSDIEVGRILLEPGQHTITVTLEGLLDGPQDGMSVSVVGAILHGRDWDADDHDDDALDGGTDCDDDDPAMNPDADEIWYDGIDQDCAEDDDFDQDGDGYRAKGEVEGGDDCLDTRADTYPGAPEVWYDGIDQDCAGDNDFDQDGDGFDSPDHGGQDCDDKDGSKYPGARTWDDDCEFIVRTDQTRTPPGPATPGGTGCSRGTPALAGFLFLPGWLLIRTRRKPRSHR